MCVCCCLFVCYKDSKKAGGAAAGGGDDPESHDDKPIRSSFDPAGYDKDLVEALERDIVQTNPNVRWSVTREWGLCGHE